MNGARTIDALKEAGSGITAPEPVAGLYAEAFRRFGTQALWSRKASARPTIARAVVIVEALRREGDMAAWRLAAEIVTACRAAI